MHRLLPLFVCFALAAAACSDPADPPPSASAATAPTTSATSGSVAPSTTAPTPSSTSPIAEPTPGADVHLPDDARSTVDASADIALLAADRFGALAPPDAEVTSASILATPADRLDQVALVWRRGGDLVAETGLTVWQPFESDPTWRAVYAFTDPPRTGVFGIRVDTGDLTGDRIPDLLSFEDTGGSGACGTYRVITSSAGDASQIFRRDACDTEIAISGGDLRIREAVFHGDDPHCCPSAFRTSSLRWDGASWAEISSELVRSDAAGG